MLLSFLNSLLRLTFNLASFASLMCRADVFRGHICLFRSQSPTQHPTADFQLSLLQLLTFLTEERPCYGVAAVVFTGYSFCGTLIGFSPASCSPRAGGSETVEVRPIMKETRMGEGEGGRPETPVRLISLHNIGSASASRSGEWLLTASAPTRAKTGMSYGCPGAR